MSTAVVAGLQLRQDDGGEVFLVGEGRCSAGWGVRGETVVMADEPPIIKLDASASDAATARELIKGMLEREDAEFEIELPEDPGELGRLILALAHEAALLALQVHHDHPDVTAARIVDMLASSEPRRGLRVVKPDDSP